MLAQVASVDPPAESAVGAAGLRGGVVGVVEARRERVFRLGPRGFCPPRRAQMERCCVAASQIQREERRQQFVKAPRGGGQFERGEGAQPVAGQRLPGSLLARRQQQQTVQILVQGYSPL